MSSSLRCVVITGIGVVTPLGSDLPTFWRRLCAGQSGVRAIRSFDASALPVRFGGEVEGFDPRQYLDRKEQKRLAIMPRAIQLAVAASALARSDAILGTDGVEPARLGVVFGAGTIPHDLSDLSDSARFATESNPGRIHLGRWGRDGLPTIPPLWMLNHVPNMPACHVSILHNAQGPCNSITQTELGGLLALGEAYRLIASDRADVLLVGGGDSRIDPISMARQSIFGRLSRRNHEPAR